MTGTICPTCLSGAGFSLNVSMCQPVIAGIGAAEILLAWRWQRSGKIVTGSRDQRL
jgi:hypothetical protein